MIYMLYILYNYIHIYIYIYIYIYIPCVDKTSRFRGFWGLSPKLIHANILRSAHSQNAREMHTKILSKTLEFKVADTERS